MKIKSFFASALCLAMLASCQNDVDAPVNPNSAPGEDTYMSFKVVASEEGASRAGVQELDGTADESNIGSYAFYIFADNKLEATVKPQPLSGNQTQSVGAVVKTGEKTVFCLINTPDIPVTVGTTTADQFVSSVMAVDATFFVKTIESKTCVPMLGHVELVRFPKQTKEDAEAHPIQIAVTRAAAKAQVVFNSPRVSANLNVDETNGFSEAKFLIGNVNKSMYVCRHAWYGTPGANNTTAEGNHYNHVYGLVGSGSAVTCNGASLKNAVTTADQQVNGSWHYITENVNQTYGTLAFNQPAIADADLVANAKSGNTSYALVEVKVTPKAAADGGEFTSGTFFVVAKRLKNGSFIFMRDNSSKMLYYSTKVAAAAAATEYNKLEADGWHVLEYTNGKAYYRVNIKTDGFSNSCQAYSIQRGNAYIIKITDITGLGANVPRGDGDGKNDTDGEDEGDGNGNDDGVDPDQPSDPLEYDAYMSAQITIKKWKLNIGSYILE